MGLSFQKGGIRFNRHELAGSFGDIGTDFPLIVSLILICGLDPASVLIMFGIAQILTGFIYKLPMPVQPLKAMAVIAISQKLTGNILYAGGLAIGMMMLVLSATGLISWIARVVPKTVVRGIQFGLGLQLASLALKDYVPSSGVAGFMLAMVSFFIILALWGNKKYPAAIIVIIAGIIYAFIFKISFGQITTAVGFDLPKFHQPTTEELVTGFLILALPQLCLSIGNSVLATHQAVKDFFPEKILSVRKIGFTYSALNVVMPFFSGIPVCHGSGGIAGHYTFGARTGGSVIIYGAMYLLLGFFFSPGFRQVIEIFPKPVLGVILFFEGAALLRLILDLKASKWEFGLAIMLGMIAANLPYGYVVALVLGTVLYYLLNKNILARWE